MRIHILGICGTFMGGLARLAAELGHEVSGSDEHVYPPMSDQLEQAGITLMQGYDPAHLDPEPDLVVIGNALSRGNAAVEHVLDRGLPYTSGPELLASHILPGRWVLAVAGTHGKTTTSSMLAWILEHAGLDPGFLIGGVPANFGHSARLGSTPFFVVEADEYDSAFFDKRSKFVHYRPRTAIINNVEFDHADIFSDLEQIKIQFHHFIRTIPATGLLVTGRSPVIDELIGIGCWTPIETFGLTPTATTTARDWWARIEAPDMSSFKVLLGDEPITGLEWGLQGKHNVLNALAAIAAARHAGVPPTVAAGALSTFKGVKRRMETIAEIGDITVYDDFAHHPTAIATTLDGLRRRVGASPIVAILEMRSNTMRAGVHRKDLPAALATADRVILYEPPDLPWDIGAMADCMPSTTVSVCNDIPAIIGATLAGLSGKEQIVIMSNGGFGGLHGRLIEALANHGH